MLKRSLLTLLWLTTLPVLGQLAEFRESEHYQTIKTPLEETRNSSDTVVVTELFSYACVHCYSFEEPLHAWLEKQGDHVEFKREHVIFSSQSLNLARAFYAAEELGVLDSIHESLFAAIHVNRLRMHEPAMLERIFESRGGISATEFKDVFDGFNVQNKLRQSDRLVRAWRIEGTPTIVVDGRYVAGGTSVRTFPQMLAVVDFLVQKVLDERL